MNKQTIILTLLFITSAILYHQLLVDNPNTKTVFVARVIDGDTFEIEEGQKVRLKGINNKTV